MKAYETELNGKVYTVIEDKNTVVDQYGDTIELSKFLDMVKKSKTENSSNDWNYLTKEVQDISQALKELKQDENHIIIDDDISSLYNGIKYSYEFVLVRNNDEFILIRELIGKFDDDKNDFLPLYNDNSENGTVSFKQFDKLSNSILWYANEVGALDYLMENLGFENLGTRYISDDCKILVVPNKQEDGFYIKEVQVNFEAQKPKENKRRRKAKEY